MPRGALPCVAFAHAARCMLKINDLARHHAPLAEALAARAQAVLASGWFVLGPEVAAFESAFARYCGVEHAIGVANGTDALELALRACRVGSGDEVVNVANAGMYTTTAILAVGATPVFVDVGDEDLSMDMSLLEGAITAATRAIVVTHLYGHLVDIDAALAIAAQRGIPLIEDCAQSHGARHRGQRAGSFGAVGCFSFYPTKNLGALGDGGALVTSDPVLAERVRALRQYGWSSKYAATVPHGRNSRLDELQASLLSVKLPHLDQWNERRVSIARRYSREIRHPALRVPAVDDARDVGHLYVLRSDARDALRAHLAVHDIAAEVHYPIPDHRQAILADHCAGLSLPVTERACTQVLTLPCFPEMTDAEVAGVVDCCNRWKVP